MAVITFPTALESYVAQQSIGQRRFDTFDTSEITGAVDVVIGGPPRWTQQIAALDGMELAIAGQWDALLMQLRGGVNHLAMHDLLRPLPQGKARGASITTSGTTALGATIVNVVGARAFPSLIRYSRDLRNTAEAGATRPWTQFLDADAGVVLSSQTLPEGGTGNVSRLQCSTTGAAQRQVQNPITVADGTVVTASVFAKADQVPALTMYGPTKSGRFPFATFRLDTGVSLGNTADSGTSLLASGIESGGNGWYRCWVTWNVLSGGSGTPAIILQLRNTAGGNYSGAIGDGLFLTYAQVEEASAPTPYTGEPNLVPGDWIQIGTGVGSHYAKVINGTVLSDADGVAGINFEPPTRQSYASGTPVTVEKALGHYKRAQSNAGWNNVPGALLSGGHSLDLVEQWS